MKKETYSEKLFKNYRKTHGDDSIDLEEAFGHFKLYYECYYKKHIENSETIFLN